jgi:hypothetical protein
MRLRRLLAACALSAGVAVPAVALEASPVKAAGTMWALACFSNGNYAATGEPVYLQYRLGDGSWRTYAQNTTTGVITTWNGGYVPIGCNMWQIPLGGYTWRVKLFRLYQYGGGIQGETPAAVIRAQGAVPGWDRYIPTGWCETGPTLVPTRNRCQLYY